MTSRPIFNSKTWPWIFAASLLGAATSLACVIAESPVADGREVDSIAVRIAGRCVAAFAQTSFDRADLTYHMGRPDYREKAFSNDVFQVWCRSIAPVGHSHLSGGRMKEILSWLRFASLLDPHTVEYHLVAAFWLMGRDIGRPDEARRILLEARAKNPRSYLPYMGLGRLYAKTDDRLLARRSYDRGIDLWPNGQPPDSDEDQVKMDKRELLAHRAILREMDGDMAGAIADMRSILALFPELPLVQLRSRILLLESGQTPRDPAEQRWTALRNHEYHRFCEGQSEENKGDDPGA